MKKWGILACLLLTTACGGGGGGGGGGDGSITPPSQDVTGAYKLLGFETVRQWSGGRQVLDTSSDYQSVSGNLSLAAERYSWSISAGADRYRDVGHYTISVDSNGNRKATLSSDSGGEPARLIVRTSGLTLTTEESYATGSVFQTSDMTTEYNYWEKVSD